MQTMTIQQAAEATGWSQRMLRYLEQAGLVAALRTPGGHRHYEPRQIERLQGLRDLLAEHGLTIADIAFERRMRTDPQVARAVDAWFGAIHRHAAPPEAGIYRRLAAYESDYPMEVPPTEMGESMTVTLAPDSAGAVHDFKVADLSLYEFGRKEIQLAEHEMPGLMALRKEYGPQQPLKGRKIAGSLHMTVQTAVLIETLVALGADVRWVSCNIFSTQDHAAAAVVVGPDGTADNPQGVAVYAWKGETLEEYWWCTEQMLSWPDGRGPDSIVDDGGDATLLVHMGVEFEAAGVVPQPDADDSHEYSVILDVLRRSVAEQPGKYTRMAQGIIGVTEETTTGGTSPVRICPGRHPALPGDQRQRLGDQEQVRQQVRMPALPDRRHQPRYRRDDRLASSRCICGYGDVGKGCVESLRGQGARVVVTEIDPICALQAAMDGLEVVTLDDVVGKADIFVTATGNKDIILAEHMSAMKHQAIVGNIGHFDNEIDMAGLAKVPGIRKTEVKPQVHEWRFPDGHTIIVLSEGRLLNLGNATGHPSFVMSSSFSNQTIAQIELHTKKGQYDKAGVRAPEEPGREGGAAPPRRRGREVDHADQGPGRVHRHRRRWAVQVGALPLLRAGLAPEAPLPLSQNRRWPGRATVFPEMLGPAADRCQARHLRLRNLRLRKLPCGNGRHSDQSAVRARARRRDEPESPSGRGQGLDAPRLHSVEPRS